MIRDHYEVLGVSPAASRQEVRAAYLRVVREHHPDHRPGDATSEETVRAANAAWEVLGDDDRRAAYDRLRTARRARAAPQGTSAVRRPTNARVVRSAYSDERERFQRQFSRSLFHYATGAFVVGTVLLLVIA